MARPLLAGVVTTRSVTRSVRLFAASLRFAGPVRDTLRRAVPFRLSEAEPVPITTCFVTRVTALVNASPSRFATLAEAAAAP